MGCLIKKFFALEIIIFALFLFSPQITFAESKELNTSLSAENYKFFQQPASNEQIFLVNEYETFYQNGDLVKAHSIFKKLFLNHKEFIPLTIYLKHCHTLIESEYSVDPNFEIYVAARDYLNSLTSEQFKKDPDREDEITNVLDAVINSIFLKENFQRIDDEGKNWFTNDLLWILNNKRNFYPDSPHYLEIRNIIDLDLINILHELGLVLEADIILLQLLALNSMADGYISKQSKKKLAHHLLWTFSYFGRKDIADELIKILKSSEEKERILSYSNSLNSDNYVLLDYFQKSAQYELAKKNFLKINPYKDLAYYYNLDLMIENALITKDLNFLNYIQDEVNRIDYKVLNNRIKLTKTYIKILNGNNVIQELPEVRKLGNELIRNLEKWADDYVYEKLANEETIEFIKDSNKRYTGLLSLILFEANTQSRNFKEAISNLVGIWEAVDVTPGSQFGVGTSSESQYKNFLKERIFYNFSILENEYSQGNLSEKEFKNISKIILQIISRVKKPTGEIELNMNFLAKESRNSELILYVTKFLESIRNRENISKKLFKNFNVTPKKIDYNQYSSIQIYDRDDEFDFEHILDVEKDLALNRQQIKRIDKDFFKKAFKHSFRVDDMRSLLKENQSFHFYDQSDNFIFNCKISKKENFCRSAESKKSKIDKMVNQYREDIVNKKDNLLLKNLIQKALFPFAEILTENEVQFVNLMPHHMGLPLNPVFDHKDLKDVVLVPSLAASTLRIKDNEKLFKGEYFGVGGNIFSKTKSLSGLNKIFDIRSGGKLSSIKELAYLPGTTEEIESVFSQFNYDDSKIILGEKATENNIRKENFGKYKFLHFATHGLVSGEIEGLSGPALALTPGKIMTDLDDGILTASDIAEMEILSEVVLLSACQTASDFGKSNGSGISNLALSFLNAGSKKIVVSQWKVDDFATKEIFINSLYSDISQETKFDLKKGLNIVKDKYKESYYWGPFIQVSIPSRYNSSRIKIKEDAEYNKIIYYENKNHTDRMAFQEKNNKDLLILDTHNSSKFSISSFLYPDKQQKNYYGVKLKSKNDAEKFEVLKADNVVNPHYIMNDKYNIIVRRNNTDYSNVNKIIHGQKMPIYLKKDKDFILYDEINTNVEHGWGIADSLIIKNKLYLLYVGLQADLKGSSDAELKETQAMSPNFKDIMLIVYDLKTKSHKKFYKTFDFNSVNSFFHPDFVNFLIKNNEVFVTTFNDYDDYIGKHDKYFAALSIPCKNTQGSTDIYSLEDGKLVFGKRIDNTQIVAWDHSNLENTTFVIDKVNIQNCSSKLKLTNSSFQRTTFITGGAEGDSVRLREIDGKKYIAVNRITNTVPIDPTSWKIIEGLGFNSNSEREWLFENSIRRIYVAELFVEENNKIKQIRKNHSRYGTNIFNFLKNNGKLYTLGFSNRKLHLQPIHHH